MKGRHEFNLMLGFSGRRLGVVHPEILEMQARAVFEAAAELQKAGIKVKLNYLVGSMIEVPRGALTADEIAQTAQFFSFGTNDLTRTALGMK